MEGISAWNNNESDEVQSLSLNDNILTLTQSDGTTISIDLVDVVASNDSLGYYEIDGWNSIRLFPEDTHFFNFPRYRQGGCSYINSEEFHLCKSCHITNGLIDIEELTEDLPPHNYYQRRYRVEGDRIIIDYLSIEGIEITLTWLWDGERFKLIQA